MRIRGEVATRGETGGEPDRRMRFKLAATDAGCAASFAGAPLAVGASADAEYVFSDTLKYYGMVKGCQPFTPCKGEVRATLHDETNPEATLRPVVTFSADLVLNSSAPYRREDTSASITVTENE